MRNLLKNVGIPFDIKTRDEAYVILQAISLLETKLGVKGEEERGKMIFPPLTDKGGES